MDIANNWADGEDAVHSSRARSPDEDDAEASRRRDRRRKRKDRYEEPDHTEFVAAGFPGKRDGDSRVTGDRTSGYRTSHYRNGGDRGSDDYRRRDPNYRPRRDDGPSGTQMLSGPCNMHYYTDSDGNRKSSHLMRDCCTFQKLLEAYGHHTPGYPAARTPAHGAPPPPPLNMQPPSIIVGQHLPQQQQQQQHQQQQVQQPQLQLQ